MYSKSICTQTRTELNLFNFIHVVKQEKAIKPVNNLGYCSAINFSIELLCLDWESCKRNLFCDGLLELFKNLVSKPCRLYYYNNIYFAMYSKWIKFTCNSETMTIFMQSLVAKEIFSQCFSSSLHVLNCQGMKVLIFHNTYLHC